MNRKQRRAAKKQVSPVVQGASLGTRDVLAEAVRHHQAGRLGEADRLYRQVLTVNPRHTDSLNLLGVIAYQTGHHDLAFGLISQAIAINANVAPYHSSLGAVLAAKGMLEEAVACYRRALDLDPNFAEAHNNLANALKACGNLGDAVAHYQKALAVKPDYAEASFNLATAFMGQGKLDEAIAEFQHAIFLNPNFPEAYNNLGIALAGKGKFDKAVAHYERALALRPNYPDAHCNLGNALKDQCKFDEAVAQYQQALILKPDYPEVHVNLGTSLRILGKLDEAAAEYRHALALKPNYAEAHSNLGNVLLAQGRLDEAEAEYRHAILLKPDYPEAHYNLGNLLGDQGKFTEAEAHYQSAISSRPNYPEALNNLGNALKEQGKFDDAVAKYRRAISLKPNYPEARNNLGNGLKDIGKLDEALAQYQLAFTLRPAFVEARSNLLMSLHYSPLHSESDFLDQARGFAQQIEQPGNSREFSNARDPNRRLRIGYVSADFREHPVGYFFASVLDAHDRANIEVACYSNSGFADAMTARLRAAAGLWRIIAGMPDAAAAELIESDAIDILVDLSGHTAKNRLQMFARKPAPVQVSWLGYFGTTGLAAMDYILADRFVVPPGGEKYFTEKVWRLPDSYLCFSPPNLDVPVAARPIADSEPLTLGCFNNWAKVSPGTVSLWAELLNALPGTRLLLKTKGLSDASGRQKAIDRFAAHGIGSERLILEGHAQRVELLAAYNRVDIALDPLPYGGGTTTAEALWMGVPVVTMRGDRWVGRVSESIVATVGLSYLVAADRESYVKAVVALADDRPKLRNLRGNLRQMLERSPLCDGSRFVRSLEAAYRGMWNAWCAGAPLK